MLRPLEIAVGFLTVFKVRVEPYPTLQEVGGTAWAFPVVGALLGILLVVFRLLLSNHLPMFLNAILVVGLWIFLSGGLHLDGWTDCWDALPASVSPERRFEILKDSRLGTFGALGLILLLAVKAGSLASDDLSLAVLFAAPVIGRGFMVYAMYGSRHRGDGMAALFLAGVDVGSARWALILAAVTAILAGWAGLVSAAVAYAAAVWFRRFAESRLPAINGDVMGAVCEVSETVFLLAASFKW
jgi:adenosylcobinamide-GDP ribazoletransferase